MVSIATSWFMPEKVRKVTIVGGKGLAVFDDCLTEDKLKFYTSQYPKKYNQPSYFFNKDSQKVLIPKIKAKEPLRNEVSHFIDSVISRKSPKTDIHHAMRVTKALDKIYHSIRK